MSKPLHNPAVRREHAVPVSKPGNSAVLYWVTGVLAVTAICFAPMLKNGFTNWDDEFYVTKNLLLRGPDWAGIMTQPVVGNYHPLTILTLAINYAIGGEDAFSYLLFNYLLHLANVALVFFLVWQITDRKIWVAVITALAFAIHPMHVESVAWVSERKDVLYTMFFLTALIAYWRYIGTSRFLPWLMCLIAFILSLVSKPAAVILPLVLFLFDYWKGRPIAWKLIWEKLPFFLLSVLFGIITIRIQSESAIASLAMYPAWVRLLFPCYVIMTYLVRFVIPYPLSAFHPYPQMDHLGWPLLISPVVILLVLYILWRNRQHKEIVFGVVFFILNLLLVLQVLSIGLTIVSERYTYVPYIGLGFLAGTWLNRLSSRTYGFVAWVIAGIFTLVFGIMTFQRTKVWRDGDALWTDAIRHYPAATVPHSNRADWIQKLLTGPGLPPAQTDSLVRQSLEDCNLAIQNEPTFFKPYQIRGLIYLWLNQNEKALEDAEIYIRLKPDSYLGYSIRGIALYRLNQPDKSLADLNKCLAINPDDDVSLNYRGSLLYNNRQDYQGALTDFTRAITLNPKGNYYLNRSRCQYMLGNLVAARSDADRAAQLGENVPEGYRVLLNK